MLTAVTGAAWEAALVTGLEHEPSGIRVVRRCIDLPDLLAAAATGMARVALVAAEFRRLDREAVARLRADGVVVVGVAADEPAERVLRQLGVEDVVGADGGPSLLVAAVHEAVGRGRVRPVVVHPEFTATGFTATGFTGPGHTGPGHTGPGERGGRLRWPSLATRPSGDSGGAQPPRDSNSSGDDGPTEPAGLGSLLAVWGPTGAPGRTTVAVSVAAELADLGVSVVLADADPYGGTVAPMLGILDEAPGVAAACRSSNSGRLDLSALARLAPLVAPRLRVLTGIPRADRWPELRPTALEHVWSVARLLAEVVVVDCGFCLEQDEELAYDTSAPRRNAATLVTLGEADLVLAVGSADPVGLARLVRGLAEVQGTGGEPGLTTAPVRTVVNRVRRGPVPDEPGTQLRAALRRYASTDDVVLVPYDRAGLDAAMAAGRSLAEVAGRSPARAALRGLAINLSVSLAGRPANGERPSRGRRLARVGRGAGVTP